MAPTLRLPLPTVPLLLLLLLTNHVSPIHASLTLPGNLANLAAAAATTTGPGPDPGAAACATAYAVVDSCYSASPGLSTAPESEAAACLCCLGSTVEVDGFYSSCAEYISQSYPGSKTQYAAFTELADACSSEMPVCGAGAGGGGGSGSGSGSATVTNTRTTTTGRTTTGSASATATRTGGGGGGSATDVPDACTSLQDIISSCVDATPSLTAAPDSIAASCVCYTTTAGTSSFTTEIDDLASSCAPWAKASAVPSAYSLILGFEDFCQNFSPTAAGGSATRTTRTRTTATDTETETESTTRTALGGGGTTRTTGTPTTRASTTTSTASGNGAAAGMGGRGGRGSGGSGVEVVAGVLGWLLFV